MSEVSGFIGKVIEELRQEDTISIIHTGPVPMAELERLDAIPKFYFFVINDHEDGVIEHQFLTKIVGAQIQTEIVKLPIKVVEYILKKGYRDMPSFKILEGLKFGTAIFDTDGEGERIVKTAKENLSISRFVGDLVHITKATFDDARTLHENEEYENAILVSRLAVDWAVKLLLACKADRYVWNFSNMEPGKVLELYGTEGMLETYRRIQGLDELPPDTARELTEEALDMIRTTLREMNITEDYLENRI